jgi:hypothetical protein
VVGRRRPESVSGAIENIWEVYEHSSWLESSVMSV